MTSLKILVSGDVEGKFSNLFKRATMVNSKNGPFEMLLCVGNFFGDDNFEWEDVKSGKLKVPLPTYILGANQPEHAKYYPEVRGCELAPGITYLGRQGILISSSGLKIAYLSGIESHTKKSHCFTVEDVFELMSRVHQGTTTSVDILLSSQWPKGVTKYAGSPDNVDVSNCGSDMLSKLAIALKPRYHFCGQEGVFYERLPYRNHQVLIETPCHPTRFISLAKVGNSGKQKWLYAFSISPLCSMTAAELAKHPDGVTECPFNADMNQLVNFEGSDKSTQFFYDLSCSSEQPKRKRTKIDKAQYKGPCWFCLRSPDVEKHLIISIGEMCYLALAKGGLVPDHVLIIPNDHHKSVIELPEEVLLEIEKFKNSLKKFFEKKEKVTICFERNYKSPHLQIQIVPIPKNLESRLKEVFIDYGASQMMDFDEVPFLTELSQVVTSKTSYFCVEIGDSTKLFYEIQRDFPLQFGREVLASPPILNMPQRTDWKACSMSKEDEITLCKKFQKEFSLFDFTLE